MLTTIGNFSGHRSSWNVTLLVGVWGLPTESKPLIGSQQVWENILRECSMPVVPNDLLQWRSFSLFFFAAATANVTNDWMVFASAKLCKLFSVYFKALLYCSLSLNIYFLKSKSVTGDKNNRGELPSNIFFIRLLKIDHTLHVCLMTISFRHSECEAIFN